MAENRLPDGLDDLFTLAEDMADGLNDNEVAIGIKQNDEAAVRAALTAAQNAHDAYSVARSQKRTRGTAVRVADSNARAFIGVTRSVLVPYLGGQWSASWLPTGFSNQSLAIPPTTAERQALLQSLQTYLTANAAQANAPLNITAARAGLLFTALSDARSALNAQLATLGQTKLNRDAAETTLRKRMRGLIDEVGQLLADNDPIWLAFGLVPPAYPDTPDAPDAPVLTLLGSGALMADWADEARATSYRVWKQVFGSDPTFVAVATVTDSDATLSSLPVGATVRVYITALNETGESQPGPFAETVVS